MVRQRSGRCGLKRETEKNVFKVQEVVYFSSNGPQRMQVVVVVVVVWVFYFVLFFIFLFIVLFFLIETL